MFQLGEITYFLCPAFAICWIHVPLLRYYEGNLSLGRNRPYSGEYSMSKAFANTKVFAASAILFAVATLFNATMNASPSQEGVGLRNAPSSLSAPVLEVGPTLPPSPWDDDAPSVASSKL